MDSVVRTHEANPPRPYPLLGGPCDGMVLGFFDPPPSVILMQQSAQDGIWRRVRVQNGTARTAVYWLDRRRYVHEDLRDDVKQSVT